MKSIITNNSISICSDYATADIENEIIKRNINILLEKNQIFVTFHSFTSWLTKKKKKEITLEV